MREFYEFRIFESEAHRLFGPNEGKKLGFARKILISRDDPAFEKIGSLRRSLWNPNEPTVGTPFFSSWEIIRKYKEKEIASANLFRLIPLAYFEPCGEQCGTLYDESTACHHCGAGGKQAGPLFLELRRLPNVDIAKSIAGEIIVSQRLVDLFAEQEVTGVRFHPVRSKLAKDLRPTDWHQFVVQNSEADVVPPTRTGVTPFDDDVDGKYRCPLGDTIGLNYLSEIAIDASTLGDSDIVASRQFIHRREGLLRPERAIFVSKKVLQIVRGNGLKGCRFEIAHLT